MVNENNRQQQLPTSQQRFAQARKGGPSAYARAADSSLVDDAGSGRRGWSSIHSYGK